MSAHSGERSVQQQRPAAVCRKVSASRLTEHEMFSMWMKYVNPENTQSNNPANTVNSFRYETCFHAVTIRAVESMHIGTPV